MRKLQITITFDLIEGFDFLKLLRQIMFFRWLGILQRAGGKVEHNIIDGGKLTIETIQKTVAKNTSVPNEKFMLKTRKREIVEGRQIIINLSREMLSPKPTFQYLADYFGMKTHVNAKIGYDRISGRLQVEKKLRKKVDQIKEALKYID